MNLYKKEIFADKVFYHIYPLGLCGAPKNNDFCQPAGNCFEILSTDLDRIRGLGFNALYIGPIFESTKHGYDTIDYYHVDRRLGNNEKFKNFCQLAHEKGFVIVLDAVFNHTGRDFFAFRDLIQRGQTSMYKDWYLNLNFNGRSCYGDCFDYDGWAGCMDLVKLNLQNTDVQNHIFGAVKFWFEEFCIDGLRLDAADVMDKGFLDKLGKFCRGLNPDFWLMGEVVHGDYNDWARNERIDSVTNYQIYNSLWGSVNEMNFFDLSYNLDREFGAGKGLYKYAPLYNFLDNHDVNRVCSVLKNPRQQLYLVYGLLFAIPGIPSVYYGSELGIKGVRSNYGDYELRPSLPPFSEIPDFANPDFNADFLSGAISSFARVRHNSKALQLGDYKPIVIQNKLFAFLRSFSDNGDRDKCLIVCNCDDKESIISFSDKDICSVDENNPQWYQFRDLLSGETLSFDKLKSLKIPAFDIKFFQLVY